MTCEECDKCKALGYRFCVRCGQDLSADAEVPEYRIESKKSDIFISAVVPSVPVIAIGIVLCALIILFNFGATLDYAGTATAKIYVYFFANITLGVVSGTSAQIYWLIIAAILIACSIVFLYDSREALRIDKPDYIERSSSTPLFWLAMLLGSTILIEIVITLLMASAGIDTSVPSSLLNLDLDKAIFLFGSAAAYEEIAFRLIPFGIPMMIAAAIYGRKDCWRFLFGGFGVSKLSVVLMIIVTMNFAYAHVSGWGWWKIVTVAIGGFVMTYLYMRFGIHASIMAHMITDMMTTWGMGAGAFGSLMMALLLFFGMLCIPILFIKTWDGIRNVKNLPTTGLTEEIQEDESNMD
jgi:hypothetical protein